MKVCVYIFSFLLSVSSLHSQTAPLQRRLKGLQRYNADRSAKQTRTPASAPYPAPSDPLLTVRPADSDLYEAVPGQTVTVVFLVRNVNAPAGQYSPEIGLPPEWKPVTEEFPFPLEPGQLEVRPVSFYIPENTPPGAYNVRYILRSRSAPSISDLYSITVRVVAVSQMSASLVETPKMAVAGEEYEVVVNLTNESNQRETFSVTVSSADKEDRREYTLRPGQGKKILVRKKTDDRIRRSYEDRIRFTFRMEADDLVSRTLISKVLIVPRRGEEADGYHRYPIKASAMQVVQRGGHTASGFQGDLVGEGSLDEAGSHYIGFRLRAPDIYETSILAEHDELYLNYRNDRLDAFIGDKVYHLSTLTENFRYGRGLEYSHQWSNITAGGFYQKPRWYTAAKHELAGYARCRIEDRGGVDLSILDKERDGVHGQILSLAGNWNTPGKSELKAEIARSVVKGRDQNAFHFQLNGQWRKFYCNSNWIYADPDFLGYYRDTYFTSSTLSYKHSPNLRVLGTFRVERQNFDSDTTRFSSPYSEYYQLGVDFKTLLGPRCSLELRKRSREDRLPESHYNYLEQSVRARLMHGTRRLSLTASAEIGKTHNRLLDREADMLRCTASMYWKWGGRQSLRAYLYYDRHNRYSEVSREYLTTGINATLALGQRTLLQLYYHNYYSPEQIYHDRDLFAFSLGHTLPNHHQIRIRFRHTLLRNSTEEDEIAALVQYTVPLNVPLHKKKNVGVVSGRVVDAETMEPVSDLIVRLNGITAVTDASGEYLFPPLIPGSYYLTIDRNRIGLDRTTAQKLPLDVQVLAGDEMKIDLAIVHSASVSGRILLAGGESASPKGSEARYINGDTPRLRQDDSGAADNGIANIIVELGRDDEVLRRLSDDRGVFLFQDLRPGPWTLRIYDRNLPAFHYLEKEIFYLDLEPGDFQELTIRALAKKRRIRMQDSWGAVSIEGTKVD